MLKDLLFYVVAGNGITLLAVLAEVGPAVILLSSTLIPPIILIFIILSTKLPAG